MVNVDLRKIEAAEEIAVRLYDPFNDAKQMSTGHLAPKVVSPRSKQFRHSRFLVFV